MYNVHFAPPYCDTISELTIDCCYSSLSPLARVWFQSEIRLLKFKLVNSTYEELFSGRKKVNWVPSLLLLFFRFCLLRVPDWRCLLLETWRINKEKVHNSADSLALCVCVCKQSPRVGLKMMKEPITLRVFLLLLSYLSTCRLWAHVVRTNSQDGSTFPWRKRPSN